MNLIGALTLSENMCMTHDQTFGKFCGPQLTSHDYLVHVMFFHVSLCICVGHCVRFLLCRGREFVPRTTDKYH